MIKVPLQAVPGFIAAVRHGNLSRAAAAMHITVSALSHQMSGLEKRLGTRLLDRGPRGVRLTAAGERLYREVVPPFDALERALRMPSARNDRTLRIDALPWFASSWLIPRLPVFVASFPEVELSLTASYEVTDFSLGDQDAALRFGAGAWPGVHAERLFDEWVLPVATPGLIASRGSRQRDDLSRWPLLGDPVNHWAAWFERFGGTNPKRLVAHFDSSETLVQGASEGIGVALVPLTLAEPLIRARRLARIGRRQMPAGGAYFLVYPQRAVAQVPFQSFRSWLLETVAHSPGASPLSPKNQLLPPARRSRAVT